MNDTDFEARLARALNVGVDDRLGAERPAPPFRADNPTRTLTRRSGPRWNRTLLAAACIIAVVVGAFALVASRNSGNDKPVPPSTQSPSPTPTPTPTTHIVTVGGARLVLPKGWTARKMGPNLILPTWCLAPTGSDNGERCTTTFSQIAKFDGRYDVSADTDGGQGDPPQWCAPKQPRWTVESGERTLGGRPAEWRRFTIACPDGTVYRHEQYMVDSLPGYLLYTDHDFGINAAVMTMVATRSTLPAQSADTPLRVYDHGVVRKVTTIAGGVRVTLTRVSARTPGTTRLPTPQAGAPSVVYDVPAAAYRGSAAPKPGKLLTVMSNGVKVTSIGNY